MIHMLALETANHTLLYYLFNGYKVPNKNICQYILFGGIHYVILAKTSIHWFFEKGRYEKYFLKKIHFSRPNDCLWLFWSSREKTDCLDLSNDNLMKAFPAHKSQPSQSICWNLKMYLSKFSNVFVPITKPIWPFQ